jgi:undecaprenyl-diphosphatase
MRALWNLLQAAKLEVSSLIVLFLLAGALFVFASIAEEVSEGETLGFDRAVLVALREPGNLSEPLGPKWLEVSIADLTSLGGTAVLTTLVIIVSGFMFLGGRHHAALLVLAASIGGGLLSHVLKELFDRARPDVVVHLVGVSNASFPSGHAISSATVYLTLGALLARVQPNRRLKIYTGAVAAALTVMIGLSRIYLGVHYPTDVLAGWCIGAAWAMFCWLIVGWLQRRGAVEGAAPN